jgi:hypothetical protein
VLQGLAGTPPLIWCCKNITGDRVPPARLRPEFPEIGYVFAQVDILANLVGNELAYFAIVGLILAGSPLAAALFDK